MGTEQTTAQLESRLISAFDHLGTPPEHKIITCSFVRSLKELHLPTYEHSIRVGLKSIEVAEYTGIVKPSDLFYPGLLHDLGKKNIRKELLEKETNWTRQDTEELKPHAEMGARIIADLYEFSSWVIRNSHKLSREGIGKLERNPQFSERSNLLVFECARLLDIIDFHDAATYRKNSRNTEVARHLSPDEVKQCLLRENTDRTYFIEHLYKAGIF